MWRAFRLGWLVVGRPWWMGLTLSERRAVTRATARRYRAASKREKGRILDELCQVTGWHRSHARKALAWPLRPQLVRRRSRSVREPMYGEGVIEALRKVWAVMDAAAGKRIAPFLPEIVARLRACGELEIDDATAAKLCRMSAATIDRRLAADRKRLQMKGRSGTKPGSLLKSQIPVRTWAEWDEGRPGFVEIDLVGHEGGDPRGEFCQTLTVTDIATGWTENRAVQTKAQKWVFEALKDVSDHSRFRFWGSTPTMGASSSTISCAATVRRAGSPLLVRVRATRMMAVMWSRRTGMWRGRRSGTTATTPQPSSVF